jgi:hypothetical protein
LPAVFGVFSDGFETLLGEFDRCLDGIGSVIDGLGLFPGRFGGIPDCGAGSTGRFDGFPRVFCRFPDRAWWCLVGSQPEMWVSWHGEVCSRVPVGFSRNRSGWWVLSSTGDHSHDIQN